MNLFERIEDYVNGTMSSEEKLRFEEGMAKDEELASATRLYKTIEVQMKSEAPDSDDMEALKNSLSLLSKKYFDANAGKVVSLNAEENKERKKSGETVFVFWLGIAAAVAVVIVVGVALFLKDLGTEKKLAITNHKDTNITAVALDTINNRQSIGLTKTEKKPAVVNNHNVKKLIPPKTKEVLFAQNFEPDVVPENKTGPLNEALENYKDKNYKAAIAAINKTDLTVETRGDDGYQNLLLFYAHYYKAISYMAISKCQAAIPELKDAISNSPDRLSETKAQWYLALTYVNTGNLDKAKSLLLPIAKDHINSIYKTKAVQLLSDLH